MNGSMVVKFYVLQCYSSMLFLSGIFINDNFIVILEDFYNHFISK